MPVKPLFFLLALLLPFTSLADTDPCLPIELAKKMVEKIQADGAYVDWCPACGTSPRKKVTFEKIWVNEEACGPNRASVLAKIPGQDHYEVVDPSKTWVKMGKLARNAALIYGLQFASKATFNWKDLSPARWPREAAGKSDHQEAMRLFALLQKEVQALAPHTLTGLFQSDFDVKRSDLEFSFIDRTLTFVQINDGGTTTYAVKYVLPLDQLNGGLSGMKELERGSGKLSVTKAWDPGVYYFRQLEKNGKQYHAIELNHTIQLGSQNSLSESWGKNLAQLHRIVLRERAFPKIDLESRNRDALEVSNADELLKALGSDRTILLKEGVYDLSSWKPEQSPHLRQVEGEYGSVYTAISVLTNFSMRGQGNVILKNTSGDHLLAFNDCNGVTLANLQFEGERQKALVSFKQGQYLTITDCQMNGTGDAGIVAHYATNVSVRMTLFENLSSFGKFRHIREMKISDCRIVDCFGFGERMTSVRQVQFDYCDFQATKPGFGFDPFFDVDTESGPFQVTLCNFEGLAHEVFSQEPTLFELKDCTFSDNKFPDPK